MFEAFVQGCADLFQPLTFAALMMGTIIGIAMGVIPVLSGMVGAALLLPFIFKMDPVIALPFLVAIMAVSYTGGAITSILVNIPGTGANVPTLLDGYPMTKKGEPGRAIGAAITSSGLGGMISVPLALLMVPLIIPLIMNLWMPEMFFLVLLGLSFLSVLGGSSAIKGLISGLLGVLLAFVGFQSSTSIPRFTFGIVDLFDGVNFLPVILGLFGLAEVIDLAGKGTTIVQAKTVLGKRRDLLLGAKDVFTHFWLWLRCSIIGYFVGIIPGIGAGMATFVSYAHAKQTSKYPEKFGTGIVEGVIAPEASNNSKEAGSVLTTLAFGIPGSAEMVILLGAFLMLGIVPGPGMLLEHLSLSFSILVAIFISNLVAAVICFYVAPYLIKLVTIPVDFMVCIIFTLILVGSFAMGETILNIAIVVFFGIVGFFMDRYNYSRPSLALGFILGGLMEHYLYMSLNFHGVMFFVRPISLSIIVLTIAILFLNPIKSLVKRWFKVSEQA